MKNTNSELLKKIYAVVEHDGGNENEKTNARRILNKLMREHGLTDADLQGVCIETHTFKYKNDWERRLLIQVITKITNKKESYKYKNTATKIIIKKIGVDCTKAQALEIMFLFNFYNKLWQEEKEMFFVAFIQKHHLFCNSSSGNGKKLSDEEVERLLMMMECMQDKSPLKQVEHHI